MIRYSVLNINGGCLGGDVTMIYYNHIISLIELCVLQGLGVLLKSGVGPGQMQYIHIAIL